ncbi:MAG: hypothetical protein HQL50_00825 [Magnetococcales bacterium]|nr:hypothetical protein [Magnetococcales bacterium]
MTEIQRRVDHVIRRQEIPVGALMPGFLLRLQRVGLLRGGLDLFRERSSAALPAW